MKVTITGGSGFIGTNLVQHFLDNNIDVLNIDFSCPKNILHEPYWKKANINEFSSLLNILNAYNPDYIIHLAAKTDLDGKALDDYSANIIGVKNILEISKQLSNLKKIIITSSMLVCSLGYTPKDQFDYRPTTSYGQSKVITEKNVWNNKPNCDWTIIRPTSIWGPWFDIPYKNFFDMVIKKRYFHIGNKSCTKTYGYVGNAIYQIEKLLFTDTSNENNKIFYIGDYQPVNIEEWANEIASMLNYKIIRVPYGIILTAACIGDLLKRVGVSFPMTNFRLYNMTTDNIVDLSNTALLAPELPYTRIQGIIKTLKWLNIRSNI
jgi:nucleoside-diphosphate-sugar epimerase